MRTHSRGRRGIAAIAVTTLLLAWASAAPANPLPCQGGTVTVQTGSGSKLGWSGIAHDQGLPDGSSFAFRILSRCSDSGDACTTNGDCDNDDCQPTCDCLSDSSCEIRGPSQERHCLTTMTDCDSDADCPSGVTCSSLFGPPIPLSSGGTPICVVRDFRSALTGTADVASGEFAFTADLRDRVFLGLTLDMPCPRCGAPSDNPQIGQMYTCTGGQFSGAACTVDAVSDVFGGTSYDCPPDLSSNVTGPGMAIRWNPLTTAAQTKTAELPCANFAFRSNPLNAPTNPGKCLDDNTACVSNADCRRCTGDPTVHCASNVQCVGKGICADAPEQPVSCGFWCQCGFCNGNASLPCFESSDCPDGQSCQVGPGVGTSQNAPQQKPNDCSGDGFVCGMQNEEECATTTIGHCSEQSYRNCSTGSSTCEDNGAGTCIISPRSCFGPRISRSGSPSSLGQYCVIEDKACTSNADCATAGDYCAADSARPSLATLMCTPATSSSSINAVAGLTGPADLRLNAAVQLCRCDGVEAGCTEVCTAPLPSCGNGIRESGEQCDGGSCCETDCTWKAPTVCRPASGVCDVAESCSGTSGACPADGKTVGTVCRAASGDCDSDSLCDGASSQCPTPGAAPEGTACSSDDDSCTIDQCDGAGACIHSNIPNCTACTDSTIELSSCDLRIRRGTSAGQDRAKLACVVDVCEANGGIAPVTDGIALALADSSGPCFSLELPGSSCAQRGSGYVCRPATGDASSLRVLKLKAKSPCEYRLISKLMNADLYCMDSSQSPWVPTLATGDDCGNTGCPLLRTDSASCPGTCGNGVLDAGEECDGSDDRNCPGNCDTTCSCR